jgi:hypothetical protein
MSAVDSPIVGERRFKKKKKLGARGTPAVSAVWEGEDMTTITPG